MWSSTVWSKIEVISRLPISPSPHLRISTSPRLPSRLPSSSFMPAVNKKILVYRGVVQIRLLHRSFFLHSSWKTAVKTVFSGFSGRATSWTVFTKLGVRVLAENRDSILYTQAMRQANNRAKFPCGFCAGSRLELCVWRTICARRRSNALKLPPVR